jgi:hypothetical protein
MSDSLTRHYAATPPAITPRPAEPHQPDEQMEHLLQLRDSHPAEFDQLPATVKLGLGYFLAGRDAAAGDE